MSETMGERETQSRYPWLEWLSDGVPWCTRCDESVPNVGRVRPMEEVMAVFTTFMDIHAHCGPEEPAHE